MKEVNLAEGAFHTAVVYSLNSKLPFIKSTTESFMVLHLKIKYSSGNGFAWF